MEGAVKVDVFTGQSNVEKNINMNVYITKINGLSFRDNRQSLQQMTTDIAHGLGIKEMGIYCYIDHGESAEGLNSRIDGIIAGISRGDLIICQFPTGNGLKFEWTLINHLKTYGGRIAIFLHELEPLLYEEKQHMLREIVNLYNQAEVLIVPSLSMRCFLLEHNIKKNMKFVIQEMWDYRCNRCFSHTPSFKKEIAFIGSKSFEGMLEWGFNPSLKLYGNFANVGKNNVHSMNTLTQDEIIYELSKGGFGLIWHQNSLEHQYMKYAISDLLSKYLAAGIPVIAPIGIAEQDLIKKNHLGLIVHSLEEAIAEVELMDESEYQEYVHCVEEFAPALRKGYYTERCLIETTQAFYRKDSGRLSIPARVYGSGAFAFSSVVLKESYGGNLALSWSYEGNADGFLIYDETDTLIYETDNIYQHYYLVRNRRKESNFIVKAYMNTLNGRLIVAESKLVYLAEEKYEYSAVSLIIPSYNAESFIVRSVDTALAQSFSNLQIIIVDDGSIDGTADILDWYAEKYPNVMVIHQENSGVAVARNTGIEKATGEYIGFLDSDDMICPDMVDRLYYFAKKEKCDIAITSVRYITGDNYDISIFTQYPMEEKIPVNIDSFMDMYLINAYQTPVVWNKLYRNSIIKNRPFLSITYEDEAWTPYIFSYTDKICYLDEGLYEYDRNMHKDTLSDECERKSSVEIFANHKRAILFYLKNGNPDKLEILKRLAQKELVLFSRIYHNVEYENLWKQISEGSYY